ncbi:hypothetical protein [Phenylobacterium sp.]|uniref:hypothetical protein n=1 Tax=Phenylobacterium sp. TaxID=1871053 RepID=UPI0025E9919D|nr:hypothetical protein [Phenylobacterium sp.]
MIATYAREGPSLTLGGMLILHTYSAAAWFRGEGLAPQIDAFKSSLGPLQG